MSDTTDSTNDGGGLDAVAEAVIELRGEVADLRARVEARPAPTVGAGEAVVWAEVASVSVAAGVLRGVAGWVEAVVEPTWPQLRAELVTCWPCHGELVQVLLDLQAAWATSRTASAAPGLTWDVHVRYVPHAVEVAQKALRGCRGSEHTPSAVKPPDAPSVAEVDAAAAAWAGR